LKRTACPGLGVAGVRATVAAAWSIRSNLLRPIAVDAERAVAAIVEAVETICAGVPYAVEQLDELRRRTLELVASGETPNYRPLRRWRRVPLQSFAQVAIPVLYDAKIEAALSRVDELTAAAVEPAPPQPDPLPPEGQFVYLFGGTGYLKIGYSTDVASRFAAVSAASPVELAMLGLLRGTRALERRLHRKFEQHRVRGEWFRDVPEIRAFFATHCDRVDSPPASFHKPAV
jgi:hypothetical protein